MHDDSLKDDLATPIPLPRAMEVEVGEVSDPSLTFTARSRLPLELNPKRRIAIPHRRSDGRRNQDPSQRISLTEGMKDLRGK
jgi:hypothetical protein